MSATLTHPRIRVALRSRPLAAASVVGVAGVLLVTRFVLLWRFPPFFDESLYAGWALQVHQSFAARWVALLNGKLPMLSWLGAALMYGGFEPLTALRLVSIAAAIVSAAFAALIAREIGGRSAGIAAAAAYAILPLTLVHDVLGLMEPLLAALFAVAFYLQVRLARRPTVLTAVILGLVSFLGLLTKETSDLPLVLLPFSLLVFDWQGPERLRRLRNWLRAAVVSCGIAELSQLVLDSSGKMSVYDTTQQGFGTFRSLSAGLAHPIRWAGQVWPGYEPMILGYLTWPLAIVALVGAAVSLWRRSRPALLCLVWILALFLVDLLFLTNAFVRYLVPIGPFVAVVVGVGFAEIVGVSRRLVPRVGLAALAGAVAIAGLSLDAARFDLSVITNPDTANYPGVSLQEYETGWPAGTGMDSLASTLHEIGQSHYVTVTWYGQPPLALMLALRHDRAVQFFVPGSTVAAHSDFVLTNNQPLAAGFGVGMLKTLDTFPRPRNGVPLGLYERGFAWKGRFYTTPDSLRKGLGLDDKRFGAFIAHHPRIRAWYSASTS